MPERRTLSEILGPENALPLLEEVVEICEEIYLAGYRSSDHLINGSNVIDPTEYQNWLDKRMVDLADIAEKLPRLGA